MAMPGLTESRDRATVLVRAALVGGERLGVAFHLQGLRFLVHDPVEIGPLGRRQRRKPCLDELGRIVRLPRLLCGVVRISELVVDSHTVAIRPVAAASMVGSSQMLLVGRNHIRGFR